MRDGRCGACRRPLEPVPESTRITVCAPGQEPWGVCAECSKLALDVLRMVGTYAWRFRAHALEEQLAWDQGRG